jgi:hypothetical protein
MVNILLKLPITFLAIRRVNEALRSATSEVQTKGPCCAKDPSGALIEGVSMILLPDQRGPPTALNQAEFS